MAEMKANRKELPRQIFITGTDTSVGKTVISAVLLIGLRGNYWKPIQSGLEQMSDTECVRKMTGLSDDHFLPETFRLKRSISPHASAEAEGIRIELSAFRLPETRRYLIVEGAGGIMVPLNERHLMLDLMKKLGIPILLVARSGLGTINHVLLSLEQLRREDLDVFGVVMNGPKNVVNRKAVERYGKVQVCAEIEPLPALNSKTLKETFEQNF